MAGAYQTAQERYEALRKRKCDHTSRFAERACEAEIEEAADEAARERISLLSREECLSLLKSMPNRPGYESASIETLREGVTAYFDNGVIEVSDILNFG